MGIQDENHLVDPLASPGLEQSDEGNTFQPSAKLIDKLNKLERWRIDPSAIEFPENARAFRGGNSTVSRAFLTLPPSAEDNEDKSGHRTDGAPNPDARNSQPKDQVPGSEGHQNDMNGRDQKNKSDQKGDNGGEVGNDHDYESPRHEPGVETFERMVVAVKKLKIGDNTDLERLLGMVLREAEFLIELSHKNIIELQGFVEDISNDRIWLIFPWQGNGDLRDFLASREWEIPERIWLIDNVAEGITYLHDQKPPICHGDLKSLNILVNSEYRALITDFGSARRLSKDDVYRQTKQAESLGQPVPPLEVTFCAATSTVTLTGNRYTLRWAAPELLMDDQPGLWSDVWAMGWIFYEVMTNAIPFQDVQTDLAVIQHVIRGDLPAITDHARMSLIWELCSLIIGCWSIDPSTRPTAMDCRKAIAWMPMIVPNPVRTTDLAFSKGHSPELLMKLGEIHQRQRDCPKALDLFNEALDVYTDIGDRKGKAFALYKIAGVHSSQNNSDVAVTFYFDAIQIYTELGDQGGRANVLCGLAHVYRLQDKSDEATNLYSDALEIYTSAGDEQGRAIVLCGIAEIHYFKDNYKAAVKSYSDALQIYADIGNREGTADAMWGLAEIHLLRDEYKEAVSLYSESLQIYTDIGNKQSKADALLALADVHQIQNQYRKAATLFSESLQIYAEIGDKQGKADALRGLAEVHEVRYDYSKAATLYSESLQIWTDIGGKAGKAKTMLGLAWLYWLQNQYTEAAKLYSDSLEICIEIGDRSGEADALGGLADWHLVRKEYSKASALYFKSLQIFQEIGSKEGRATAMRGLAEVHQLCKEYGEATILYSDSLQICEDIGDKQGRADSLHGLAVVKRLQDECGHAVTLDSEALQIYLEIGDRNGRADALLGLSQVYRLQGHHNKAILFCVEALQSYDDIGNKRGMVSATLALAEELVRQDLNRSARPLGEQTNGVFGQLGSEETTARAVDHVLDVHEL